MRHPIVCGIDGSKESREAARVAAELAHALARGLVLVHAADDPPTFPYGDIRQRELQRREATDVAHRRLDDVAAGLPAIRIETQVLFGDPIEALTSLCDDRDAALLVVGARGRSGLAAAWHGTISARLAGATGCPVVVVSPAAAEQFLAGQRPGEVARELQSVTSLPDRIAA
jgi:nucleotide-binding universal stress UspA family protein